MKEDEQHVNTILLQHKLESVLKEFGLEPTMMQFSLCETGRKLIFISFDNGIVFGESDYKKVHEDFMESHHEENH